MFKGKLYATNLLIFITSCTFSFIVLEILLSRYLPEFNPGFALSCYRNDEGVGFLWPRDSIIRQSNPRAEYNVEVSINSHGLRDKKDIILSKPNDLFFVGDSFVFGEGVEEDKRFTSILESISGIQVYNLGIPGTDFEDYMKIVNYEKKSGVPIHNLIIAVYMGNDIRNYSNDKQTSNITYARKVLQFIHFKSTTYHVLSYIYNKRIVINKVKMLFGLKEQKKNIDINESTIHSSAIKLKEMANGYNVLILIIPSKALWLENRKEIERRKHINFVSLLNTMNMNVVDLYNIIDENDPLTYYFNRDGHFNQKGHLMAGNTLRNYIKNGHYIIGIPGN